MTLDVSAPLEIDPLIDNPATRIIVLRRRRCRQDDDRCGSAYGRPSAAARWSS